MFDTDKFYFVGNNLAIDFVNTKIAADGHPKDLLESLDDLVAWSVAARLIPAAESAARRESWRKLGSAVLIDAVAFRARLHGLFVDLFSEEPAKSEHIAAINDLLRSKKGYSEIVPAEGGLEKVVRADLSDPGQVLSAIAESAADLLAYGDLSLIRKCENPECVLFFYDTTKNHKRRWCSMAGCGNRAKAKAFYDRKRRSTGTA